MTHIVISVYTGLKELVYYYVYRDLNAINDLIMTSLSGYPVYHAPVALGRQ
jgi:hypothetical protein